jgi:hypothetical protein
MLLGVDIADEPKGSAADVTEVLADRAEPALLYMVSADPRHRVNFILFGTPTYCATAPNRKILCECNAASATLAIHDAAGPFKHAYDAGDAGQLFGLDPDLRATHNRPPEPGFAKLRVDRERELRVVVDPDAADRLAKSDEAVRIIGYGRREVIRKPAMRSSEA